MVALLTCSSRNFLIIAKYLDRTPHTPVIVPRQKVRGRVLSKTDQKKLVKAYEGGATIRELAEEYATSKLVIKNILRANKVRIKLTQPTRRDVKEMIRLYESGLSLARTGERIGFDPVTVRKYLLTKGVEMRNTRGE